MYVEKFPKLCFGNKVSLIRALFYFLKQVSETFQKLVSVYAGLYAIFVGYPSKFSFPIKTLFFKFCFPCFPKFCFPINRPVSTPSPPPPIIDFALA